MVVEDSESLDSGGGGSEVSVGSDDRNGERNGNTSGDGRMDAIESESHSGFNFSESNDGNGEEIGSGNELVGSSGNENNTAEIEN